MKRTSALAVLLMVATAFTVLLLNVTGCGQGHGGDAASAGGALHLTVHPAAPSVVAAKPPTIVGKQPWRIIHNDAEAKSEIARFNAYLASRPSAAPTKPTSDVVDPADDPWIGRTNPFVVFCRGGGDWEVQGCTGSACFYPNYWGDPSQPLPGTGTGAFMYGFDPQPGGFTGVGNITSGSCVTSDASDWAGQDPYGVSTNVVLFPGVALTGLGWWSSSAGIEQAYANSQWNLSTFSTLTAGTNSIMDSSAIFEFIFTLYMGMPASGPIVGLYNQVSFDWDYNTGSSPGY